MVEGVGRMLYSRGMSPRQIIKEQLPRSVTVGYIMEAINDNIEKAVGIIAVFLEERVGFTGNEIRFFADKMIEAGKADKAGWLLGHYRADVREVTDRAKELFDDSPYLAGMLLMGYGRVDEMDPADVVDLANGFIRDGVAQYAAWLLGHYKKIAEISSKHIITLAMGLLEEGHERAATRLLVRDEVLVDIEPEVVVTICQKLNRVDILDKYISKAKLSKDDIKALLYLKRVVK